MEDNAIANSNPGEVSFWKHAYRETQSQESKVQSAVPLQGKECTDLEGDFESKPSSLRLGISFSQAQVLPLWFQALVIRALE